MSILSEAQAKAILDKVIAFSTADAPGQRGELADSFELAERLLTTAGVAATPGLDFGKNLPQSHMRFAYTIDGERIEEGLARMARLLDAG